MRARLSPALAVLALVVAALALAACSEEPKGLEKVRLALDFQPNAVHSGIYTTVRDGADERHGVKLEVRVPSSSTDSLKLLSAGRADMAVVDIHDLALARERGEDLVGVGALVQRPLAAVIARSGIRRPRDLEGRRVGVTGLPSDEAVLRAVVTSDGGDLSRVHRVTIGFSAVPSLVTGRVDAALAFWNAEGVTLRRRGVHTREFRVDRYGAPRYPELVLAVTRRTLDERRDVVKETLAALADGTEEALRTRPPRWARWHVPRGRTSRSWPPSCGPSPPRCGRPSRSIRPSSGSLGPLRRALRDPPPPAGPPARVRPRLAPPAG